MRLITLIKKAFNRFTSVESVWFFSCQLLVNNWNSLFFKVFRRFLIIPDKITFIQTEWSSQHYGLGNNDISIPASRYCNKHCWLRQILSLQMHVYLYFCILFHKIISRSFIVSSLDQVQVNFAIQICPKGSNAGVSLMMCISLCFGEIVKIFEGKKTYTLH